MTITSGKVSSNMDALFIELVIKKSYMYVFLENFVVSLILSLLISVHHVTKKYFYARPPHLISGTKITALGFLEALFFEE